MINNRSWNKYEYALLIEVCTRVNSKEMSPDYACRLLSINLRKMAVNNGEEISDTFRNEDGMRWYVFTVCEALTDAASGRMYGDKNIMGMLELYRNNRPEFIRLLKAAREIIEGKTADDKEKASFKEWLFTAVKDADMAEKTYETFSKMSNVYGTHTRVKRVLYEIEDESTYKNAVDEISRDNYITRVFRDLFERFKKVSHYYIEYLQYKLQEDDKSDSVITNSPNDEEEIEEPAEEKDEEAEKRKEDGALRKEIFYAWLMQRYVDDERLAQHIYYTFVKTNEYARSAMIIKQDIWECESVRQYRKNAQLICANIRFKYANHKMQKEFEKHAEVYARFLQVLLNRQSMAVFDERKLRTDGLKAFDSYQEALKGNKTAIQTQEGKVAADNFTGRRQLFFSWLDKFYPEESERIKGIFLSANNKAKQLNLLQEDVWEISDIDKYRAIAEHLWTSARFRLSDRALLEKFHNASRYYEDFLVGKSAEEDNSQKDLAFSHTDPSDDGHDQEDQGQEDSRIDPQVEEIKPAEDKVALQSESYVGTVDYKNLGDLTYTKPQTVEIFGKEIRVGSWKEAYLAVIGQLREKNKMLFYRLCDKRTSLIGSMPDFCLESKVELLRKPAFIGMGCYAEVNLSASEFVKRIKKLVELCEVDEDKIKIIYSKGESVMQATEKADKQEDAEPRSIVCTKNETEKAPNTDKRIVDEVKEILLDYQDGISKDEIGKKVAASNHQINDALESCGAIYINGKYYHKDNICDFDEMADILLEILQKQFKSGNGFTSSAKLFSEASIKLEDFFFDNNGSFESEKEVYDLARHLFEVAQYKGNTFIFTKGMYIWEKDLGYSKDASGLLVKFAEEKGSAFNKDEAMEYLSSFSENPRALFFNIINRLLNKKLVQCGEDEFICKKAFNFASSELELIKSNVNNLMRSADYIPCRQIADEFYESMPGKNGIKWSAYTLRSVFKVYDIGFTALKSLESDWVATMPAAIVRKDSKFKTFADIVWMEWYNDNLPIEMQAEEFRQFLCEKGFIGVNEKKGSVEKTVWGDSRFMWTDDNKKVIISKQGY